MNSKTREELALVACGQLQQSGAYPTNVDFNVVYLVTFPTWRTSGEVAPVDGYQKMPSSVSGCWRGTSEVSRTAAATK